MKARHKLFLAGIVGLTLFAVRCTSPTQSAGNGSDVGNGMVAGILYEPDGTTPARGAKVYLRKKNTLADTTGALLKRLATTTDTVTTDDSGKFVIDSVDTGIYVIEGSDGSNNLAINDSVPVVDPDSTVTLPPDTLKPAGAIKGVIRLSEGGDPRKVFVLAFGIDRFARVNADGSFKFNVLAEGKYDLRLISSLDNYGVLDTVNIPVKSADTTNLGTIDLPFTGIPTPKNVAIAYDTLKQIVTLMWSKPDTALVKGFNVYRRNVDSNTVLKQLNTNPITDTLYRDSTGIQDQTYEYRVSAFNASATEGTKSSGVSVKVVGPFNLLGSFGSAGTNIGQFQNPTGLALGNDSSVFVVDVNNNRIQKFDLNANSLSSFGASGSDSGKFNAPLDVAVDRNGNVFVADQQNNRLQKLDKDFKSLVIQDSGLQKPKTIAADSKGNVYVNEMSSSKIKKYDNALKFILEWGHGGNDSTATGSPQSIAIDSLDRIFVVDNPTNKIAVFDTLGRFLTSIPYSSFGKNDQVNIQDISIWKNSLFATDAYNGQILEFGLNGKLITKGGKSNFMDIVALPNNELWVTIYPDQKVYRYKR